MVGRAPATAQQLAYEHLRQRILDGDLAGGSLLKPEQIAAELGVSRMPVREAIRQLDAEGLVLIRPNRSAVVQSLGPEDVAEIFEIRSVLEGLAARRASMLATPEDFADLRNIWARMERAKDDPDEWLVRHDAFHAFTADLARRPRLAAQIALLRDTCRPYFRLHMAIYGTPEAPGFSEMIIIEALESGAPEIAERAMQEHVLAHSTALQDFLQSDEARSGGRAPEPPDRAAA